MVFTVFYKSIEQHKLGGSAFYFTKINNQSYIRASSINYKSVFTEYKVFN